MANDGLTGSWRLGVNLSGAEYGDPYTGRLDWDYTYPTVAELDHYAAEGARIVRIPISLERLQPTSGGGLDAAQLGFLDALVAHAAANGQSVILDPHNYGYAHGVAIGSTAASDADFADFWSKLAAHYAHAANVVFGLMNEPHVQAAAGWLASANQAIAAIRLAGATQQILVPGTWWDTGATWLASGNADALAHGVIDPSNNVAIEVHQYLDTDNSGTHDTVVSATIGADRLRDVTAWAERTGNHLFLGEFGVASDPLSLQAMSLMLAFMQAHSDVWLGGTYWAGGPWIGNYVYASENPDGTDTPQMTTLRAFMTLPGTATVTPTMTLAPLVTLPTATALPVTETPPSGLQLFRFFDTHTGSQFLTSDPNEVAKLVASRPDMVFEGPSLTSLASAQDDPAAVLVRRFFDTTTGAHFYSADTAEIAHTVATRPDLILEDGGFYEHAVPQAGEVPVYRFFERSNGTHFYTASPQEHATINLTRPDMVDEGIAFYARG